MWIYTYEGEKEAVDKERIMKILAGIITIAGIVVLAFLILDNKAEQRKVQQVAAYIKHLENMYTSFEIPKKVVDNV